MAPPSLLSCPLEVQTLILSNLPPIEIHDMGKVSKHFRDLVNNPSNATLLYGPSQERSMARIQDTIDRMNSFDEEADGFLAKFAKWVAHRGICLRSAEREQDIHDFVLDMKGLGEGPRKYRGLRPPLPTEAVPELLLDEHIRYHLPGKVFDLKHKRTGHRSYRSASGLRGALILLGLTSQNLEDMLQKVRETPGGYFKGPIQFFERYDFQLIVATEALDFRNRSPQALQRFSALIGVPFVPDMVSHWGLNYHVQSNWAYGRVEEALRSGRALRPHEKTAVLEEVKLR